MDFNMSDKQKEWLERVQAFMTKHVRPAVPVYKEQDAAGEGRRMAGIGHVAHRCFHRC